MRAGGFPPPTDFPLFRKNGVFLGFTASCFICFHFEDVFPMYSLEIPWLNQVCDSQVQVQGDRKLPAQVWKREGCLEACQLRSRQGMEKEPEPRTLHGKSSPSSSGRNSCLRILICLAKLSSCNEEGKAEPKLNRTPQAEVKPFIGRLFKNPLQNVSLWTVATMAHLASSLCVYGHLGKYLICLIRIRALHSSQIYVSSLQSTTVPSTQVVLKKLLLV